MAQYETVWELPTQWNRFTFIGEDKQEILANDGSFQDNSTQEICKKLVSWCHKGPRNLDYLAKMIERRFTKIGGYYWCCGNDYSHNLHIPEQYNNILKTLKKNLITALLLNDQNNSL